MIGWWHRRRAAHHLAQADAAALRDLLGDDGGYHEARRRARLAFEGSVVDHDRPLRHRTRVGIEVGRRSRREVGLDTATRFLER